MHKTLNFNLVIEWAYAIVDSDHKGDSVGHPGAGNSIIVGFWRDSAVGVLCGDGLCAEGNVDFAKFDELLICAIEQRAWTFDPVLGEAMQVAKSRDTNDVYACSDPGDVLWGGKGNDVLTGGLGGYIYIFQRGDGHNVISERCGVLFGPGAVPLGWRRGVVRRKRSVAYNDNWASDWCCVAVRVGDNEREAA